MPPAQTSSLFVHPEGAQTSYRVGLQNVNLFAFVGQSSWGHKPTIDRDGAEDLNGLALQPVTVSLLLTGSPPEDRLLRAAKEDGLDWAVNYSLLVARLRETVMGTPNQTSVCRKLAAGASNPQANTLEVAEPALFNTPHHLITEIAKSTLAETGGKCNHAHVETELPAIMLVAGGSAKFVLDASAAELESKEPVGTLFQLLDVKLRLLLGLRSYERLTPQTVRMWLECWDEEAVLSQKANVNECIAGIVKKLESTDFFTLEALATYTTSLLLGRPLPDGTVDDTYASLKLSRVSVRFVKPNVYIGLDGPAVEATQIR